MADQEWRAGNLSMPCVATSGVAYLPDPLIEHLKGKTVYVAYDNEEPKGNKKLSPGDEALFKHGQRLRKHKINVLVITLPRPENVKKVDLDSFLLARKEAA